MDKKEHICTRMIQVIESKGLVLTNFEEKWKEEGKISVGYLARSARVNRNIGIHLIEYFLDEFPDTDVQWLITGTALGDKNNRKHTAATNEAAVWKKEAEKFRKLADGLSKINLINAQTISEFTGGEMVE